MPHPPGVPRVPRVRGPAPSSALVPGQGGSSGRQLEVRRLREVGCGAVNGHGLDAPEVSAWGKVRNAHLGLGRRDVHHR